MKPARHEFRDRRNYVLAALSEIAAPLLRGAARAVVRAPATPPDSWRRGLILGNGHIGDVLYRTASLEALASRLPDCEWFYLTTPFAAEVLHGNPAVARVLPWMSGTGPETALETHRVALRDLGFDVALCTENVRIHASLATAVVLRIPNRVAFTQKGMSGLATHGVRLEQTLPRAAQVQAMVASVTGTPLTADLRPRVYADAGDIAAAATEWDRVAGSDATVVIACAVTARQSIGVYPPGLFADILRAIVARAPGARIVLIGARSDEQALTELAALVGPSAVVSAGRLGLRAVVSFLARCDAFVGSDSGPRHLANAAGIPVFFIRNLGSSETETGAYLSSEHDLAPPGEFLTDAESLQVLATLDAEAVASRILATAARARGTRADTPR